MGTSQNTQSALSVEVVRMYPAAAKALQMPTITQGPVVRKPISA